MRTVYLTFPRMTISLAAPEEIQEKVSLFYPFNIQKEKPSTFTHEYRIESEGETWELQKDEEHFESAGNALEAVARLEYDLETTIVRECGNWLAIHAGCVDVKDQACLIVGNPDTGKTTTTFHLVEMGQKFMCEEIAFLDAETREVHPYLQTLSLESSFMDVVKPHFPLERGFVSPLNPSLVRYTPENIRKDPLNLSTILVPKRDADAEPEIIPLKPSECLTEFLSYCFEPNVDMEELVDSVIKVLEECLIFRIVFGDSVDCRKILIRLFKLV